MVDDLERESPCPACGAASAFIEVGSASERPRYQCPKCGPWVWKDPAAVALGRRGGLAAQAGLTEAERRRKGEELAKKRWQGARLKLNVKPGSS